jgi:epoxyqueuosine reductase
MITSEQVKQFVRKECKVDVVGIAPATPYNEEDKKRARAVYETLRKANPAVDYEEIIDPEIFVPSAKSVIVFAENYYFGQNPYGESIRSEDPHGVIGNFYLNTNILNKLMQQGFSITKFLESNGFKAESAYLGFSQKIKAIEAGIARWGKNTILINDKLGSEFFISTIITDAPLEPDGTPLQEECGKCNLCVEACPTGALSTPYTYQIDKCIIYYLMHLKDEIPLEARDKLGLKVGTCGICRDVCPHNENLKINEEDKMPDEEIYPDLIPMMNMGEDEYEQRYGAVMFGFIMGGSRYLRRNVAVALGNSGSKKALPCLEIAAKDEDQLVRSHAEWAIEKIKVS